MSNIHDEYEAARIALNYVLTYWHRYSFFNETELSKSKFENSSNNLEQSYFVRLYAEFEGILKDHLRFRHSHVKIPDNPKVDWLISRVIKCESFSIDPALRAKMNQVRDYRNSIAHKGAAVKEVPIKETLARLNTFLAKLPNP